MMSLSIFSASSISRTLGSTTSWENFLAVSRRSSSSSVKVLRDGKATLPSSA